MHDWQEARDNQPYLLDFGRSKKQVFPGELERCEECAVATENALHRSDSQVASVEKMKGSADFAVNDVSVNGLRTNWTFSVCLLTPILNQCVGSRFLQSQGCVPLGFLAI